MQQNFGFRELTKTILTITGLLLLVIFGTRAASQASNIAAVRGEPTHALFGAGLALENLRVLQSVSGSLASTADSSMASSKPEVKQTAATDSRSDKQANRLVDETKAKLKSTQDTAEKSITGVAAAYQKSEQLLKTDVK